MKRRRTVKAFAHRRVPEYQAWIRSFACLLRGRDPDKYFSCPLGIFGSQCAHVQSRGAGGDDIGNCVPLCAYHHDAQHTMGIVSFQQHYGIDLHAIARDLGRQYAARKAVTERWGT